MTDKSKAILWMLGAMASLLSVSIFGKLLSPTYDTFEIMFYRSIFGFLAFLSLLTLSGQLRSLNIKRTELHLLRNILHFTAQNLWFYALAILPLSIVIAFEFTTPAWVILIAALILNEGFNIRKLVVIVLSLIGIIIITGPSDLKIDFSLFAAIAAAIGFALTMIATKQLTKYQSVNEILLMMTFLQGVFAAIIIIWRGNLAPMTWAMLPWLVLIGIFGTMSHYCLTKALKLADASVVSPIDLVRLPLSILLGAILFGDHIALSVIAGSMFLLFANYLNMKTPKSE